MAVTINGVSPTTAQQREFAAAMGLPVLLQTVTVGTAQQDIDFTSLDLDADRIYRIELSVSVNSSADQGVSVYYNSDLTAANYQNQYLLAGATLVSTAQNSNAYAMLGYIPTATTHTLSSTATVSKLAGKSPTLFSDNTVISGANVNKVLISHRWSGTANITAIKLRHAALFGVGTVAKIYKV